MITLDIDLNAVIAIQILCFISLSEFAYDVIVLPQSYNHMLDV